MLLSSTLNHTKRINKMNNNQRKVLADQYLELTDKRFAIADQIEALRAIVNHLITDNSTDTVRVLIMKQIPISYLLPDTPVTGSNRSGIGFFTDFLHSLAKEKATIETKKLELEFSYGDAIIMVDCMLKIKRAQLEKIDAQISKLDFER